MATFEQDYVSLNAKEAGKLNVIKVKNPKNLMGDKEEVEITQSLQCNVCSRQQE